MLIENIKEAFASIISNKMRSILTMLGIIIGISSVILITTIGSSIRSTLSATLNSLGGNSVSVYLEPYYPENDEDWDTWEPPEMEDEDYITQEMVDGLIDEYPEEIQGIISTNNLCDGKIKKDSEKYANVSVQGVTAEYLKQLKLNMVNGRSITQQDCDKAKGVAIVCDAMVENYFGDENPIGKTISVDASDGMVHDLVIVGVYEDNETLFGKVDTKTPKKDRVTNVFIPYLTSFKMSGNETSGYEYFDILLTNTADSSVAEMHISEYLNKYYADNKKFHITTFNMSSNLTVIDTVLNVITVAISGIAAISLIVGGVGVMNIMLVSITERTREIGVRMALGAKRKTIRTQFVIEAIVLCLIGGIIGILLGLAGGMAIGSFAANIITSNYANMADYIIISVHPSATAIVLSVVFSMLTGVFFGYYPANKASKMEVIDALRYE